MSSRALVRAMATPTIPRLRSLSTVEPPFRTWLIVLLVCASGYGLTDKSAISFHLLNSSRGPAGWGHRAQISRTLYRKHMQEALAKVDNLTVQAGSVSNLLWAQGLDGSWKVEGVRLGKHSFFWPQGHCDAVGRAV